MFKDNCPQLCYVNIPKVYLWFEKALSVNITFNNERFIYEFWKVLPTFSIIIYGLTWKDTKKFTFQFWFCFQTFIVIHIFSFQPSSKSILSRSPRNTNRKSRIYIDIELNFDTLLMFYEEKKMDWCIFTLKNIWIFLW